MAITHETLDLTAHGLQRGAKVFVYLVNPWNRNTVRISEWEFLREGWHKINDYYTISVEQAREMYSLMVNNGFTTMEVYDNIIEGMNGQIANQFARMFDPIYLSYDEMVSYSKYLRNPAITNIDIHYRIR